MSDINLIDANKLKLELQSFYLSPAPVNYSTDPILNEIHKIIAADVSVLMTIFIADLSRIIDRCAVSEDEYLIVNLKDANDFSE